MLTEGWRQELRILLDIHRPSTTNHSQRFRNPKGLHRCLRFCARVLELVKPMDQGVDRMDTYLQLIPGHPRLCLLVDLPPLQSNSRITPIRLGFPGNTHLPRRVADTAHHIPLLTLATLLLELRTHHRGSPRLSTTLMSLTLRRRVTRRLGISHHPILLSIPRHPDQPHHLTIHLQLRPVTAHLNHPHKHPIRSPPTPVGRASRQHRLSLLRITPRRSRLLLCTLPRSRRILRLNQDTHRHNLLTLHRRNRDFLFNRRRNSHHISRRTLLITRVLTRRSGILLRDRARGNTHSLGGEGKVRSGTTRTLL